MAKRKACASGCRIDRQRDRERKRPSRAAEAAAEASSDDFLVIIHLETCVLLQQPQAALSREPVHMTRHNELRFAWKCYQEVLKPGRVGNC